MNKTLPALILLALVFCQPAQASEFIRVLLIESPYERLPDSDADTIDAVQGKVFMNGQFYTGHLEILRDRKGLYVITTLPFEDYVEGVVASEVGGEWEAEALKAQAVISRTYAAFYRNANAQDRYHLTSSVLHQVYKGENTLPRVSEAVESTNGEIITFNNAPIRAVYHATCSGMTENPEEIWREQYPYLSSVACKNGKATPYKSWKVHFSLARIAAVAETGPLKDVVITSRTATGRAKILTLIPQGSTSSARQIAATDLRRLLGYRKLPSTMFDLARKGKDMYFSGSGSGHAVGLSQWGALEMARAGRNYREIIAHFYPGTTLSRNPALQGKDHASRTGETGNAPLRY